MIKFFLYLLLFGAVLYILSHWNQRQSKGSSLPSGPFKPKPLLKAARDPREIWFQVYETDTLDEARRLQARIQEEEVECIVYEQGKKDIHGNLMKGIGIAVPKTATRLAQGIINRMLSS